MENSNRKKAGIILIVAVLFLIVGSTYAFITITLTGTKKVTITASVYNLILDEENEITISNALPMYDEVGMIQKDVFMFNLVNNSSNSTNYILKLKKVSNNNELSPSTVKYHLTKNGIGKTALLSTLTDDVIDDGTISGGDTINYTLRLWIDDKVTDESVIAGKSLSYMLNVEIIRDTELNSNILSTKVFSESDIGTNCKTYDDGVDTFLVGQCEQNYVWYSGKLWRVVLKNNETGAIKIITENVITALSYNEDGKAVFENSYMDQWLNQEFLPTLRSADEYLDSNSKWYVDAGNGVSMPSGNQLTRSVGLLNSYEHNIVCRLNDDGYLENGSYWWLISPAAYNNETVFYSNINGGINYNTPSGTYGVRPVVNLKPELLIVSGTGKKSDPYILEKDLQEESNNNTPLNTRVSGEYIEFNDELYRIVDIEDGLTKITALDKPSALTSNKFHSSTEVTNFAQADIKTDLENYYQGLKTTNVTAFNMIEPNTTWYLGVVGRGVSYKMSVCESFDANTSIRECVNKTTSTKTSIGLPRFGEMFTSGISRGTKADFWTLTPYNSIRNYYISNYDVLDYKSPTNTYGARPSMYLKQNVVIAKDNAGNGTYEKPYKIELGQ